LLKMSINFLFLCILVVDICNSTISAVKLGTAINYVILTGAGITTTGTTSITGNVGITPATSTSITGFVLVSFGTYFTSRLVTGHVYAADCTSPTPSILRIAQSDSHTAYLDAANRTATKLNLGSGSIGSITLAPAVYYWSSPLNIVGNIELLGPASAVWIFKVAQTLDVAASVKIILSGGAVAANIFWQVAGAITLGSNSAFQGTVLAATGVALKSDATLHGRFLAQTAVTLISNTLVAA